MELNVKFNSDELQNPTTGVVFTHLVIRQNLLSTFMK